MLLLFYFLFLTISQTFTDRKQIYLSLVSTNAHPATSPNCSTHRLSSGLSLNTTGAPV